MSPKPLHIAVIGAGSMGSALLAALSGPAAAEAGLALELYAVEPNAEARARLGDSVKAFESLKELPALDCAVLAVKPQIMGVVLPEWRAAIERQTDVGAPLPLTISIAAGVATETIEAALPEGAPVVRTMPNLALTVSRSVTALCAGRWAHPDDLALAESLMGLVGRTFVVAEDSMDAVCALSGSGPAYFALLAEAMAKAGAALGLDAGVAQGLATETLIGTAALLAERGIEPIALRRAVTSPAGTTEAAVDAMEAAGFDQVIVEGVDAAWRRGRELGKSAAS